MAERAGNDAPVAETEPYDLGKRHPRVAEVAGVCPDDLVHVPVRELVSHYSRKVSVLLRLLQLVPRVSLGSRVGRCRHLHFPLIGFCSPSWHSSAATPSRRHRSNRPSQMFHFRRYRKNPHIVLDHAKPIRLRHCTMTSSRKTPRPRRCKAVQGQVRGCKR